MTSDESQPSRINSLLTRLQRKEAWLEIDGYHVGNIHSPDKPVSIPMGSTVVGHVFAPKVVVAGLLCGNLVTTKAEISKNGKVWGDLFTVTLNIKPGGKIQGWINSIDEETAVSLQNDGALPDEIASLEKDNSILQALESEHIPPPSEETLNTYQQLQTEAAQAQAARAEIEINFEEKIKEVAGGSSEKIQTLTDQLNTFETENLTLSAALSETNETLSQKEAQLERHQAELELTRSQIQQLQQSQTEIKAEYSKLSKKRSELEEENSKLNNDLTNALVNIDSLTNRVQSVEEAMKDSLQHSSELQDSLERWQELAEVTEAKAKQLESEIATLTFNKQGSEDQLEVLKSQKKQIENEWHEARSQLEAFRSDDGYVANEAASEQFIDEASVRMANLEELLVELAQSRAEQEAWYQLNLENRSQTIAELNDEISELKEQLLEGQRPEHDELTAVKAQLEEREAQLLKVTSLYKKQKVALKSFQERAATHIKKLQAQIKKQKTA